MNSGKLNSLKEANRWFGNDMRNLATPLKHDINQNRRAPFGKIASKRK